MTNLRNEIADVVNDFSVGGFVEDEHALADAILAKIKDSVPPQTEYTRADLVAPATLPISDAKDKRIVELEAEWEKEMALRVTAEAMLEAAETKLAKAIGTLTSIEKWAGEFPPTNKFWPHGKPMSYVAAYGSNGERDFMREKARTTIAEIQGNP